jgi:hypothetical protein
MDKHFVCPGCGGVADHQKNCDTASCSLQGQAMKECSCQDGEHAEVMQSENKEE